jgi:hypothetical protein
MVISSDPRRETLKKLLEVVESGGTVDEQAGMLIDCKEDPSLRDRQGVPAPGEPSTGPRKF